MDESFSHLCTELKKFTSFRESEEIKGPCNESLQMVSQKQVNLPISTGTSPFVKAITSILRSNKPSNTIYSLVNILFDCISHDVFVDSALSTIIREFDQIHNIDNIEFSLKIIQFMSSTLQKHLVNLNLIKSLCSIVLNFLSSKHTIVVNSSYAAIQQMISTEFNFIQISKYENLNPEDKNKLKVIVKNGLSSKFSDPLCVIAYLIINDVVNLLLGKNSMWLHISNIPFDILVKLWEAILMTQSTFLKTSHQFIKIVENSISNIPISNSVIHLDVTFCKMFYSDSYEAINDLLTKYLELLAPESDKKVISLSFFRELLLEDENFFINFKNLEIITDLLKKLDTIIDTKQCEGPIDFNFSQNTEESKNLLIFPCEISILLVNYLISNKEIEKQTIVGPIISIIIKLLRICNKNSCETVFRTYNGLITELTPDFPEYQLILLRILCSIISQQRIFRNPLDPLEEQANILLHTSKTGFWFKGKRVFSYHLVSKLLFTHPEYFSKIYNRLFGSLSLYDEAKVDPAFTTQLSKSELINLSKILINGSPFSIQFLSSMIPLHLSEFTEIWNNIFELIPSLFEKDELCSSLVELMGIVSNKMVSSETEQEILKCYSMILNLEGKPSSETRVKLIDQLNIIIKHFGSIIDKGWPFLLSSIKIQNCVHNSNTISSAFTTLTSICTDHLQKLSDPLLSTIINLIIEYTAKNPDLNIALTAIGLLWNIVSQVNKNAVLWKQILSLMMTLFNDPRPDVSSGALSTFFSLLTSNSQQMPQEIFPHLLENCIIKLLESYVTFPAEKYSVSQHALCEIGHCVCSFWPQFDNLASFRKKLWPLLIEKVFTFLTICDDPDICSSCMRFYEDVMPCNLMSNDIRELLLYSFEKLVYLYLDREQMSNFVISEIGKVVQRTLPTQKQFLTETLLDKWLNISEKVSLTLPCENIVNNTSQKCIITCISLLPIEDNYLERICKSLAKIALKSGKTHVINCIMTNATKTLDDLPKENLSLFVSSFSEIYSLPAATSFLKKAISLSESFETSDLFKVFTEISIKNGEVSKMAIDAMINSFSNAEKEDKVYLISRFSNNSKVLIDIFEKYMKYDSKEFSQKVFDEVFEELLLCLKKYVEEGDFEVMKYLKDVKVPPKSFGNLKDCQRWHLHFLACSFSHLLLDNRKEISQLSSKIVADIATDFTMMTKNM
ncbi:hypothetical protein TVAG_265520 [Trichomonas vaginalis G3]|uniref:Uncharacterized protein n=1 Tax=Trichomonas vaginalis (strain ATCC PRA-98 / G3) TaxID=412133 RepID=A2FGB7_TRIV3|nr:guanyl-nucleotide exchange factor family [Trichomonas vaginalis G3]EAX96063.1 hypothetical protein TVAG_265520 [Trichomonas vaginalis G3]KAI5504007.1 guanyl-nucleotide exchange factor family [Trichomonas vaginalis G3]|eukprot:XP_001308993.1 hypothetical protein [Trichomonas vaginalis G3]